MGIDPEELRAMAEASAQRAEAAGAFVEAKLGDGYHDDYFGTAKLTLWIYDQHLENERLRAAIRTAIDACEFMPVDAEETQYQIGQLRDGLQAALTREGG